MEHSFSAHDDIILLNPIKEDEIEHLRTLRNREEIRCCFLNSDIISAEAQQAWFASYKDKPGDYMFTARIKDTIIGFVGLYNHCGDTIEWGRLIVDPEHQGKGYSKRMWRLVRDIALNELKVKYITGELFESNQKSLSLNKSFGFKVVSKSNGKIKILYQNPASQ